MDVTNFFDSHGLSVQSSSGSDKGRCLVARNAVKAGKELFRNAPVACVATKRGICGVCFKPLLGNINRACSRCKAVQYCSTACQRTDWPRHKLECICLSKTLPKKVKGNLLLLTRLLRLLHVGGHLLHESTNNTTQELFGLLDRAGPQECSEILNSLQNHRSLFDSKKLLNLRVIASLAQKILLEDEVVGELVGVAGSGTDSPADAEIDEAKMRTIETGIDLLCQAQCNCHTICDEQLTEIGIGLYIAGACVNHSCCPSAIVLYDGHTQVFRATRDIAPGDEITISYIDLAQPTGVRRSRLQKGYFFQCECQWCLELTARDKARNEMLIEMSRTETDDVADTATIGAQAVSGSIATTVSQSRQDGQIENVTTLLREAEKLGRRPCKRTGLSPLELERDKLRHAFKELDRIGCGTHHFQRIQAMEMWQSNCLGREDFETAMEVSGLLTAALSKVLDPSSAVLGLQFYKEGKLAWYFTQRERALDRLRKAAEILCTTHGSKTHLVRELLRLCDEARAEKAHFDDDL